MTDWTLDGKLGAQVMVDVCTACQAFWFDRMKSLQLAPGSTLKLLKYIGEHSASPKPALAAVLHCPKCALTLTLTHDIAMATRFVYWRCGNGHGHFIGFFDFLKEKNFIHPLSPREIQELREKVQTVNCANCGASIDLQSNTVCPYCHSAISMLDLKQQKQMLEQLKEAAEPMPVDPTLPMKLALAKAEMEKAFAPAAGHDSLWWDDAQSGDLVQAGLKAVIRWLTD
jgi:endogenous inhibitor of DNA gyrase (YacG/DUF329 family)